MEHGKGGDPHSGQPAYQASSKPVLRGTNRGSESLKRSLRRSLGRCGHYQAHRSTAAFRQKSSPGCAKMHTGRSTMNIDVAAESGDPTDPGSLFKPVIPAASSGAFDHPEGTDARAAHCAPFPRSSRCVHRLGPRRPRASAQSSRRLHAIDLKDQYGPDSRLPEREPSDRSATNPTPRP